MTPAARTQAAIELLDAIILAARDDGAAADTLVARYFKDRRYAGSKDRRAVRDLVYAAVRLLGDVPASGRAAMVALADSDPAIAATFDGSTHAPPPIAPDEPRAAAGTMPGWLDERLHKAGLDASERAALVWRASLDVRINRLRADASIADTLSSAEPIAGLPDARRLPAGTDLSGLRGIVEPQDAGSQAVTLATRADAGMAIVDLCAGAGGKTLALAAMMGNIGAILATDTDRARLSRLPPRVDAAGVTIATTRLLDPGREAEALPDVRDRADVVLVDAPCSGTGTWRRNPEARWRLTPARLERLVALQRHVLGVAALLVRPGGALVYVVCSLLDEEGRDQVDAFLASNPAFAAEAPLLPLGRAHGHGVRLTPAHDGCDGFYVARLVRAC